MPPVSLKSLGKTRQISIRPQQEILDEALSLTLRRYATTSTELKNSFDDALLFAEESAYRLYRESEAAFGGQLFEAMIQELISAGELRVLGDVGPCLARHFATFNEFFLSLSQSRKSKAGKSFEFFHNELFRRLGYPFEEQQILDDSKPDFLMPSLEHYERNPLNCVVFTAKRTLRERWRQITTEGTRGIGLFLATIDPNISSNQLEHMLAHKIFVVCPEQIRKTHYANAQNVLSFARFFTDHLDPKLAIWKRDKIVPPTQAEE